MEDTKDKQPPLALTDLLGRLPVIRLRAKNCLQSGAETPGVRRALNDCCELCDAMERLQNAVPVIDRLQARLEQGCTIAFQDGLWHLFLPDGNGFVSGITLKKMLFELVFVE